MSNDVNQNYMNVIKDVIFDNIENSTFEARQEYLKLYSKVNNESNAGFFTSGNPSFSLEKPDIFAFGFSHFYKYMENCGWKITKRITDDFEMGDLYNVSPRYPENSYKQWDIDLAKYQSAINLPCLLEKLYFELRFLDDSGNPKPLYNCCECAQNCWAGLKDRRPPHEHITWSYPSYPWIGPNYSKDKILVLGINSNEGGGLDFNTSLVKEAREELAGGKTRVNFGYVYDNGKAYVGSYLWHRMACYARAVRCALHCDDELYSYQDDNKNIQSEYDNFTFINHVKCSPTGERSKPGTEMWENCGQHVLKQELEILHPDVIIVLGTSDNIYYFENRVLDREPKITSDLSEVRAFSGILNSRKIGVISVPHPASSIKETLKTKVFDATFSSKRAWRQY